jgi:hypothetical protein
VKASGFRAWKMPRYVNLPGSKSNLPECFT